MKVCMVSSFRNASLYLRRYMAQAARLALTLSARGDRLECVWGEGDSTDGTRALLMAAQQTTGLRAQLVDASHGGPEFGSVVDAQRFRQLAHVGNVMWRAVPKDVDAVIFVESDLIWDASTMIELLGRLEQAAVIAPMVFRARMTQPRRFYDTWAARKDGVQFRPRAPYHPALMRTHPELVEVDSMGSCLVMRGPVAQGLVWPEEDVIVGVCRQLRERGARIWLHTGVAVAHE